MSETIFKQKKSKKTISSKTASHALILLNDDVNTFDYVADCLVEICKHEYTQAFQCTLIAHHKGKCEVKRGNVKALKNMNSYLSDKGLTSYIIKF